MIILVFALLFISPYVACLETIEGVSDPFAIIRPELGDYNTTSCSSAPSCGVAMSSYNGVSAYSNGAYQCTGFHFIYFRVSYNIFLEFINMIIFRFLLWRLNYHWLCVSMC